MMSTHSFAEPFLFLELLLGLQITWGGGFLMWIEQHQIINSKEMSDSVLLHFICSWYLEPPCHAGA